MDEKKSVMSAYMPERLRKELREEAKRAGLSLNSYIVFLLTVSEDRKRFRGE